MKIITWNCQGAFRKKAKFILAQKPDILVIQECEHPDKLIYPSKTRQPTHILWHGDLVHKGLCILSYGPFSLTLHESYDPSFKFITPVVVTDGSKEVILFAVWANNAQDKNNRYVEQIWKALHHYEFLLDSNEVILTGDFNSNTIWDREHRIGNHSHVVEKLASKNIHSIYHKKLSQEQGKELHPTFYLHRDKRKPYHLDYCFASDLLYQRLDHFELGTFRKLIRHSDHLPMIMAFRHGSSKQGDIATDTCFSSISK